MISNEELRVKLSGYPEQLIRHFETFGKTGEPEELHAFVLGLIKFLHDVERSKPMDDLSDEADLRADLGIDSITIAEVVFLLEEILEIEINNEDLAQIQTVGELKRYILGKVDAGKS